MPDDTTQQPDAESTPAEDAQPSATQDTAPSNQRQCAECTTPYAPDLGACPNCGAPNPALGAHLAGAVSDEDRARAAGEQAKHALRTTARLAENNTPDNIIRVEKPSDSNAPLADEPGEVPPATTSADDTGAPAQRRGKKDSEG